MQRGKKHYSTLRVIMAATTNSPKDYTLLDECNFMYRMFYFLSANYTLFNSGLSVFL